MDNLPYVTAALICERVIQGKDEVLSVIRIVDAVEIRIQATDLNTKIQGVVVPGIQLTGLISIKSGPFKGKGVISIDGENPSGKVQRLADFPVDLKGDENGQNVILNIALASQEDGMHWFNVRFNDSLLTRIPLKLVRVLEQVAPDSQTNESPKSAQRHP